MSFAFIDVVNLVFIMISKTFVQTFRDLEIVREIAKRKGNKDDNIHKSEALKLNDKQTLTLVECQN